MAKNLLRLQYLSGWIVLIVLSVMPVVLWMRSIPLEYRFTNLYSILGSGAQLTGLVGMSMFALAFIMSARLSALEDYFGGMNKVYIAHHILGGLAFVLLLIHPLFSAIARAINISPKAGAQLFLPSNDWSINFALIALGLMMVLLIITFFAKLRYQLWKLTHQFLGVAFFFGGLHALLISSDVSIDKPLRYYMLTISILGLVAYVYRTLLSRFIIKKYTYAVTNVLSSGDKVVSVMLAPVGKKMDYYPGQFVFISFDSKKTGKEQHPFSLSSSPLDDQVRLSIKSLGDFTDTLPLLKKGDIAHIEGPFGRFFGPGKTGGAQIWIAGGIGITPFLSMARTFRNLSKPVDLFYMIRDNKEAVHLQELLQISQYNPKFRVFIYETATKGRLTAEIIKTSINSITDRDIFICGPPAMMKSMREQFVKLHISNSRIHSEEFALL